MKNLKLVFLYLLILIYNLLSARCNEWAEYYKGKHISSYARQDSIHWIGTGLGLMKYNSNSDSLQHLFYRNGVFTGKITDIEVSNNGSVWFVINNKTLLHYDGAAWRNFNKWDCDFFDEKISKITTDNGNNLYVMVDLQLIKFDGKKWEKCTDIPMPYNLKREYFIVFEIITHNDVVWVRTSQYLAAYKDGEFYKQDLDIYDAYRFCYQKCMTNADENTLLLLFKGDLFTVTLKSEITMIPFESDRKHWLRSDFQIGGEGYFTYINYVTKDYDTEGKGHLQEAVLSKFNENSIQQICSFPLNINTIDRRIRHVEMDEYGNLWFFSSEGFYNFRNNETKRFDLWKFDIPSQSEVGNDGIYRDTREVYNRSNKVINGHGKLVDDQEEGYWLYKDSAKNPILEGNYEGGKRVGTWKKYYRRNKLYQVIEYNNGFKDGLFIEYSENYRDSVGTKRFEGQYSKGIKTGTWKEWYKEGQLREVAVYENDVKDGDYKFYSRKGWKTPSYLSQEGMYINDERHGLFYIYEENKTYKKVIFENDKKIEDLGYFSQSGNQIYAPEYPFATIHPNILNEQGNKQGLWITFMNGNFEQATSPNNASYYRIAEYDDGIPQGLVRDYYKSGDLQFEGEMISEFPSVYKDGVVTVYKRGNKEERSYVNNKKNGITRIWKNNVLITEGNYVDELQEGWWEVYSDGKLVGGKQYRNGNELEHVNLKNISPVNLLQILKYSDLKPVFVAPISAEEWNLEKYLKKIYDQIKSDQEVSVSHSVLCSEWQERNSTLGREAMYILEGFIQGIYPPTESSFTDFYPKVKRYKNWWKEYQKTLEQVDLK